MKPLLNLKRDDVQHPPSPPGQPCNALLVASTAMSAASDERRASPLPAAERHKTLVRAAPLTREEFSASFDRCFGLVYAYVSRCVSDRASCERIVREVLATNLDVLAEERDEQELGLLKAASDRLIRATLLGRTPA